MDNSSVPLRHALTVRKATKEDLDEITRIHVKGFPEEPLTHYCFPLRFQHPEDYWKWTKQEYSNYLEQPEKFVFHVLEAASDVEDSVVVKLVGIAVWNVAVMTPSSGPDPFLNDRKDANKKRCEAFRKQSSQRFHTHFAKWAEEQVNLSTLVVHPDFRRRGAGTMLIDWGIERAARKDWPLTLCASPSGKFLYDHLRFSTIAVEVAQVEGEEETLEAVAMVRESGA